jgi:hypothetical protein
VTPQISELGNNYDARHVIAYAVEHMPLRRDEFDYIATRIGRQHGPALLAELVRTGLADDDFLAHALPIVWEMHEHPEYSDLPWFEWDHLFRQVGFIRNGIRTDRPEGRVLLYRGATYSFRRGMSWTSKLELAEWYADYYAGEIQGEVWAANVPWSKVLAVIDNAPAGEAEYVVDTQRLRISSLDRESFVTGTALRERA